MLNNLRDKIHENAKEKGFWDGDKHNISEKLMLVVSELGEACESLRKNKKADLLNYEKVVAAVEEAKITEEQKQEIIKSTFEEKIKDTFEDEIADSIIRCLDLCGYMNIDITKHIQYKMQYNSKRERLHGKLF